MVLSPRALIAASLCSVVAVVANQVIAVGEDGLSFTPSSIVAAVGSRVEFQFYPLNHSVVSGTFDKPCQPDGKMFSGYVPVSSGVGSEIFVIAITDASPMWYYCSQNVYTHCQSGMVGVINPPGSGPETLAAYKAAAANTTGGSSGAPDQVVGGTVELATAAASASTSATATVSTVTFAASGCPGNGMKKRRIAGREV